MIWYSNIPVPPVVAVIVIVEVLVGQVIGELSNSKSVGGFKGSIVISLVTKVQSLASLMVMV